MRLLKIRRCAGVKPYCTGLRALRARRRAEARVIEGGLASARKTLHCLYLRGMPTPRRLKNIRAGSAPGQRISFDRRLTKAGSYSFSRCGTARATKIVEDVGLDEGTGVRRIAAHDDVSAHSATANCRTSLSGTPLKQAWRKESIFAIDLNSFSFSSANSLGLQIFDQRHSLRQSLGCKFGASRDGRLERGASLQGTYRQAEVGKKHV